MLFEVYKYCDLNKNKLSISDGQVATNVVSRNRYIKKK